MAWKCTHSFWPCRSSLCSPLLASWGICSKFLIFARSWCPEDATFRAGPRWHLFWAWMGTFSTLLLLWAFALIQLSPVLSFWYGGLHRDFTSGVGFPKNTLLIWVEFYACFVNRYHLACQVNLTYLFAWGLMPSSVAWSCILDQHQTFFCLEDLMPSLTF